MVCAVLCADLWKLWEIPSAIGWGFAPEVGVARKAGLSYRGCKDLKSEFVLSLNLLNWYIIDSAFWKSGTLGC